MNKKRKYLKNETKPYNNAKYWKNHKISNTKHKKCNTRLCEKEKVTEEMENKILLRRKLEFKKILKA